MHNALGAMRYRPKLRDGRMVLGFSGWMDGGEASTGTIEYLVQRLGARKVTEIDPEEFYIYNFPGSMEVTSLFRPHGEIEDGLVTVFEEPTNIFYCNEKHDLVLFKGREPNFRWRQYAECIFALAEELNVGMIYFVGSVAGVVPHTRELRIFGSVSEEELRPLLSQYDLEPSNYEGPTGLVTYMMKQAKHRGVGMASLVAEIPAYVQGRNVKSINAVVRKVIEMLGLSVDLGDLELMTKQFERKLNEVVEDRPELADLLRKMENNYDKEVEDIQMADLRAWFEKQDIRLNLD